jgi:hypothetical protein
MYLIGPSAADGEKPMLATREPDVTIHGDIRQRFHRIRRQLHAMGLGGWLGLSERGQAR